MKRFTRLLLATALTLSPLSAYAEVDWKTVDPEVLKHYQTLVRFDTTDPPGNEQPVTDYLVKVLKDAGLVDDTAEGTRRIYRIDPQGLGALRAWLDQFWEIALDAFKAEVERDHDTGETS